jgi:hypothetical protein
MVIFHVRERCILRCIYKVLNSFRSQDGSFYYEKKKSNFLMVLNSLDHFMFAWITAFNGFQVSIAKGHPRSATESYKRALKRIEFNEEEYHMALQLPNVDFVSRTVEELISVLHPKVYDITTDKNST